MKRQTLLARLRDGRGYGTVAAIGCYGTVAYGTVICGTVICGTVACGTSKNPVDDGATALPVHDAGPSADGTTSGEAGPGDDAGSIDARAAGDADAEGGAGDGSIISVDGGDGEAGPIPNATCFIGQRWSTRARVASIASAQFGRFGGISANALTVAWTDSSEAGTGAVYVADRPGATAAFGAPVQLDTGTMQVTGRVAVAPTGLGLVAALADGSSFAGFVRLSTSSPWVPSSGDEFAAVAAMRAETGGTFSDPVLSLSGRSFFFVLALTGRPPALYESQRGPSAQAWGTGQALSDPTFAAVPGDAGMPAPYKVARPTGASSDDRTLFFYDEVKGRERAAWRDSPVSAYAQFIDLPFLPQAAPVEDCLTVYFQGMDAAGPGLFTGTGP
jgi:hypothetical protein